ncbi:amino acid ABC transporter substrate-binding protein, partial [Thermodesulfobacteriota bacterium]
MNKFLNKFRTVLVFAIALSFGMLIACGNSTQEPSSENINEQEPADESMIEQVLKRGVLKVGMSTFKPWAMKDKTGKLIGFEIDVATRLAED